MASSNAKPAPAPNLATILAVKRKIGPNKADGSNPVQPVAGAGAHSQEKMNYRQDPMAFAPAPNTTKPDDTSKPKDGSGTKPEPNKGARNTKQLDVGQLDKKMEEIQRKQQEKTNEAIDSWKAFEDMNYGFYSDGMPRRAPANTREPINQAPAARPVEKKPEMRTLPSEPTPKKPVEEPPKVQEPIQKPLSPPPPVPSPIKEESPKPSLPPTPPPRRSRSNSHQPLPRERTLEREPPRTFENPPTSQVTTITPIPLMRSNPQPAVNNTPIFLGSSWQKTPESRFKVFPDVKSYNMLHGRNACRSIQRSMDRYRFYVW